MTLFKTLFFTLVMLLAVSSAVHANSRLAILAVELNDRTLLPNTPQELARTASFKPLLAQKLSELGEYDMIAVDANAQKTANAGVGYLFQHHDAALSFGQQLGTDWLIVSQHSKPSFLYSHLLVQLFNVKKQRLVDNYLIELKGSHEKVTQKAIAALAKKIQATISE